MLLLVLVVVSHSISIAPWYLELVANDQMPLSQLKHLIKTREGIGISLMRLSIYDSDILQFTVLKDFDKTLDEYGLSNSRVRLRLSLRWYRACRTGLSWYDGMSRAQRRARGGDRAPYVQSEGLMISSDSD